MNVNVAVHALADQSADVEAEAVSFGVKFSVVLSAYLAVGFEQFLLIFLRDAWTIVFDFNLNVQFWRVEVVSTELRYRVVPVVRASSNYDLSAADGNELYSIG